MVCKNALKVNSYSVVLQQNGMKPKLENKANVINS